MNGNNLEIPQLRVSQELNKSWITIWRFISLNKVMMLLTYCFLLNLPLVVIQIKFVIFEYPFFVTSKVQCANTTNCWDYLHSSHLIFYRILHKQMSQNPMEIFSMPMSFMFTLVNTLRARSKHTQGVIDSWNKCQSWWAYTNTYGIHVCLSN